MRPVAAVAVAVGVVDAVLAARGAGRARWVTKPAVVPAVAVATGAAGGPVAVRAALAGSWIGDVALLSRSEAGFLGGVGAFAAAHVAYLRAIRDARPVGAAPAAGERWVDGAFALTAATAGTVLWRRLGPPPGGDRAGSPGGRALRGAVLGYVALVSGMGAAAVRTGRRRGGADGRALAAGGVLFVVSDGLVALDHFGGRPRPAVAAAVMVTYGTAQALLAGAISRARERGQ